MKMIKVEPGLTVMNSMTNTAVLLNYPGILKPEEYWWCYVKDIKNIPYILSNISIRLLKYLYIQPIAYTDKTSTPIDSTETIYRTTKDSLFHPILIDDMPTVPLNCKNTLSYFIKDTDKIILENNCSALFAYALILNDVRLGKRLLKYNINLLYDSYLIIELIIKNNLFNLFKTIFKKYNNQIDATMSEMINVFCEEYNNKKILKYYKTHKKDKTL